MDALTDRFRTLHRGDWVHCLLYGGKDGVIVDIRGEQSPSTCQSIMNGTGVTGGSAQFMVAWEDASTSMVSEALLRMSVQWSLPDRPPVGEEEVIRMRAATRARTERDAQSAQAQRAEFDQSVAELKAAHPHLKCISANENRQSPGKFVAGNLRIELKRAFPKTKFSVRSDYSTVNVGWDDGPTQGEVDAILDRYKTGRYNANEDYHDSVETPWTAAFGGADYVFSHRELSVDNAYPLIIEALYRQYPDNMRSIQRSTTQTMRTSNQEIDGLGCSVRDALYQLSRYWNATTKQFVASERTPNWISRFITKPEQSASTPPNNDVPDAPTAPGAAVETPVVAPDAPTHILEDRERSDEAAASIEDENGAYNSLC